MLIGEDGKRPCRVAVYGTLKRGLENNYLLKDSLFLGTDSLDSILLYDLGSYPGARRGRSDGIEVEIYRIEHNVLLALDQLEEFDPRLPHSSLYRREPIPTVHGNAWIYLFNGSVAGRRPLTKGSWQPRVNPLPNRKYPLRRFTAGSIG
jgi:gamma-glutamylcyclotransferase (GGCT)/AIG2-like uncharacterized protein YtfP